MERGIRSKINSLTFCKSTVFILEVLSFIKKRNKNGPVLVQTEKKLFMISQLQTIFSISKGHIMIRIKVYINTKGKKMKIMTKPINKCTAPNPTQTFQNDIKKYLNKQ